MGNMHLNDKLQARLERQLQDHMPTAILKRGWQYYKESRVISVKTPVEDILTGIVKGSERYAVVMDADQHRYSSCSCPYGGACKHMAAVFFQYCRELEGASDSSVEGIYFHLLGLFPAREATEKSEKMPEAAAAEDGQPGREATCHDWRQWMESAYGEWWKKCRHSIHLLGPLLTSLKSETKDWQPSMKRLHWMLCDWFVLDQAERALTTVDSYSRYYHEVSFARTAEPWMLHMQGLLDELQPNVMGERELEWMEAIAALLFERALRYERQMMDWEALYMAVNEKLHVREQWYDQQMNKLQSGLDNLHPEHNEHFLHSALANLFFLHGDDGAAREQFSRNPFQKIQKWVYPLVARRMDDGRWEEARSWMAYVHEHVAASRNPRMIGPFVALCRKADERKPELPEWREYMLELLPYSYQELSEHWMKRKNYREWVELQLLVGTRTEEISRTELRQLAEKEPEVLLPLYHQSVESAIASRNRQGYRSAVKGMKQLEGLYGMLGQQQRWERYRTGILTKYQRLRALQEELWKEKLDR
ncbi:SWIM zinc finger family protein [Paenibacillus chungangensis]|uniref:SWIM zinc finger domain-containing protein n=1 Tax=Paenibacillus chungangensis TaxID=696535 RepID=A0ABW3HLJ5_9BACL